MGRSIAEDSIFHFFVKMRRKETQFTWQKMKVVLIVCIAIERKSKESWKSLNIFKIKAPFSA